MKRVIQTDNQGNALSPEQIAYFKNSKVRQGGRLIVCYHGTKNPGFKEFDARNGSSQFGKYKFDTSNVNYFSTDIDSASSYTEFGYESEGNVYYVYVNIENPYVVNNESLSELKSSFNIKDSNLRKHQVEAFDKIFDKWETAWPDESDVPEINKDLSIFNVELKPADDDSDLFDLCWSGNNSAFGSGRVLLSGYSIDELFSMDMYDEFVDEVIGEEDDYYFSTDDIVKMVLYLNKTQGTNYDGVLIEDIIDSKNMFSASATDVITLKSSNQIKSIDNIHPTSSSNIENSTSIRSKLKILKDQLMA